MQEFEVSSETKLSKSGSKVFTNFGKSLAEGIKLLYLIVKVLYKWFDSWYIHMQVLLERKPKSSLENNQLGLLSIIPILSIYLTYFRKWFFPLPSFSSNQTLCWGLQFAVRVQTSSFCDGMYLSCIYLRRDGANVNNVRKTLNYPHKTNIITLVNEEPWNQNNIWYLLLL